MFLNILFSYIIIQKYFYRHYYNVILCKKKSIYMYKIYDICYQIIELSKLLMSQLKKY
jgi:hypothetical protein